MAARPIPSGLAATPAWAAAIPRPRSRDLVSLVGAALYAELHRGPRPVRADHPRGVETHEVVGIVLLLRGVLARSLFEKYRDDFDVLNQVLGAYEPAANRIANTVAVSFVEQRERIIRQQQDSIRELSTPVLQVRESSEIAQTLVTLGVDLSR